MIAPEIHVGTSGYSFDDWVGPFYPPGTPKHAYLEHYAQHFGCVEVNVTYYRVPPPGTLARMAERTPPGFRFVVKLHQSMTHEPGAAGAPWDEFRRAIAPLAAAGKFHGLLAQFPWGFRKTDAAKAHLELLRREFPGEPLWVEFRHASWMHRDLPAWLAARELGYCVVDEPALPGLVPPVTHVTNGTGYVRFHGRNAQTWWGRGGGDRYDYDYSERELNEWVAKVGELAQQAKQTYLFFNNCHAGQAARNAKLMEELLRRQKLLG